LNIRRLPYRLQIPLGLAVAVVIAALLVTVTASRLSAHTAREASMATVGRATDLLAAQVRPFLAADDTWRVFALLRNTAVLLPGGGQGHSRAAVLDAQGRVFAASEPEKLATGAPLLGQKRGTVTWPAATEVHQRLLVDDQGLFALVDPIRSEDGQLQGFVYAEVEPVVFEPDWSALSRPALIGTALAVLLLVPVGWWIGRSMTKPVVQMANYIEAMGEQPGEALQAVPPSRDRELGRISRALQRLTTALRERREAEERALSAQRMAAVGRLTAAVAHEINNPLGGLLNATQTLRVHGGDEEVRLRTVDLLERGLQQIRGTVAALLPQARVEERLLEGNDLGDVVTLLLPIAARRQVEIRSSLDLRAKPAVPSGVFRQVMLNLLQNAVKAAGEKGTVHASLQASAEEVRFTVSNTGERLTAEGLQAALAAERGNDPRGFGLWVCREVATQFGGGLDVVETAKAATELTLWIPNGPKNAIASVD
jgi:signal transduction histidine kinase